MADLPIVSLDRRSAKAISVLLVLRGLALSSAFLFRQHNGIVCSRDRAPRSRITDDRRRNPRTTGVLDVAIDPLETLAAPGTTGAAAEDSSAGGETNTADGDDTEKKKNTLTFRSSFERQSDPLAELPPDTNLQEFLLHADHILSAGKSMHSKLVPHDTRLLEEWAVACDRVGACPPDPGKGLIMSVRTAGISIPGLSVEWSALIGTNLVHKGQQKQYPELEFVLIKDESKVSSGAKPIVWIYNKLTEHQRNNSSGGKKKQRSNNFDTKLYTRLGFQTDDGTKHESSLPPSSSLRIRCIGTMEMKFRIPAMLGKLVFSSSDPEAQKAKAELKMSNLITRQIEKDTEKNVRRWEENLREWVRGADERGEENAPSVDEAPSSLRSR